MARCQVCGDTGMLNRPESEAILECQCAVVRRLAASMPPHIRRANAVREHFELPLVKRPFRSAFVVSSWADTKAMVKAVIMTNPASYVRITSDREILDVWLGKKSRGQRDLETRKPRAAADMDGSEAVYSSIEDLMDLPKLCVVRLNEIGYKNKSAPGVLLEAIEYRVDRDKPVWVIQDVNKPFVQGSPAWSESVWEFISTSLPSTQIPRLAPAVAPELRDEPGYSPAPAGPGFAHRAGDGAQQRMAAAASAPAVASPSPSFLDPEAAAPRRPQRPPRQRSKVDDEADARPSGLEIYGVGLGGNGGKGRFKKGD